MMVMHHNLYTHTLRLTQHATTLALLRQKTSSVNQYHLLAIITWGKKHREYN